jgi:hypothetical protein
VFVPKTLIDEMEAVKYNKAADYYDTELMIGFEPGGQS